MNRLIPFHERPRCKCHEQPMYSNGAGWCCSVRKKAQIKLYAKRHPGKKEALIKEWRKNNPERMREKNLQKSVGISVSKYNDLLLIQNGVCAICGSKPGEKGGPFRKNLSVDHDHVTGKVRGLLCHNCNTGLGFFSDDIGFIERAVSYLKSKGFVEAVD